MALQDILQLRILTLNIWGIPFVSKDRQERVEAIGTELAKGNFDVVSLQEVWTTDDYEYLRARAHDVLPYSHYFHSGVFGSGLCILSRYPITSTLFHSWSVNGYMHRIQHGDWFGGKGVGLCQLLVNEHTVHVYIAHLHAEYDRDYDEYKAHRVIQAYDTAQFIEATRGDADLQVLAGDLNIEDNDLSYKVLVARAQLIDASGGRSLGTYDTLENSYTPVQNRILLENGKRIDYILYRAGKNNEINVTKFVLPFDKRIPNGRVSHSDHEAVTATICASKASAVPEKVINNIDSSFSEAILKSKANDHLRSTLRQSIQVCNESLTQLLANRTFYVAIAVAALVLLFTIMDWEAPYGMKWAFVWFRIVIAAYIMFNVVMATVWNAIEKNGILSGKLAMEMQLNGITDVD